MRVFFVSDIHGSETCFRKLVNAGKFYGADLLIMGGDLAGKELVPVVEQAGSWTARFRATEFTGRRVFLRAVDVFDIDSGLVRHESSWYGDGWLRQRHTFIKMDRATGTRLNRR